MVGVMKILKKLALMAVIYTVVSPSSRIQFQALTADTLDFVSTIVRGG